MKIVHETLRNNNCIIRKTEFINIDLANLK